MVEYWNVEDPVFSGVDFKRKILIFNELEKSGKTSHFREGGNP